MNKVKFLKHCIKFNGKNHKCHYSPSLDSSFRKDGKVGITIYGRNYSNLPSCLNPKNNSDVMIDYFENDKVFIECGTEHFKNSLIQAMRIKHNQSDSNIAFLNCYLLEGE